MLALPSAPARAETPFVNDPEMDAPSSVRDGRKWQEQAVRLPAWPQDADLVEIKIDGPADEFRHAIDTRSLATGSDDVVRYTLVTESTSGARNISYEGLRCTPKGKYKTYAYGSGARFSPTSNAEQWIEIDERGRDRFRFELWRHYLCVPRLFKPRDRKDQVRMLKSGRVPQTDNAGFLTN
ncbi:MAG: CNP1-like family protein [Thiohalocapsa sp.]